MNELPLKTLCEANLRLLAARSKKEFYGALEEFFRAVFGEVRFSVLVPIGGPGEFAVECSTEVGGPCLEFPSVSLPVELMVGGGNRWDVARWKEGRAVAIGGASVPVAFWKELALETGRAVLFAFHTRPQVGGREEAHRLADFLIEQAMEAFRAVWERDLLSEQVREGEARLEAMRQFGGFLGQLDLEALLAHLLGICVRLSGAQVGSVVLRDEGLPGVEWGLPATVLESLRKRGGPTLTRLAQETGEPVLVHDLRADRTLEAVSEFRIDSFLCVPLASKRRVLGTVNLINGNAARGGKFSETDRAAVVTIASLAATAIENAILQRGLLEKERIEANLQIARSIQRGMYPVEAVEVPGYDIAWFSRSCDETGGDYFDFLKLGGGRLGLVMGDVSGHGVGAALLMATGRANLRALLSVKDDLVEVVERLNDLLAPDMDENFMTLFVGRLDYASHKLAYVNAGHDRPLFLRQGASRIVELTSTGTPLGMFPGSSYGACEELPVHERDLLLLTTDGVWEARNRAGVGFGKARLREVLARNAARDVHDIVGAIVKEVEDHLGASPPQDDLSLAVVRRRGG